MGKAPRSALLVTIGGLRADRLNAHLYPRPTTYLPFSDEERRARLDLSLDGVAGQGVAFARAFAPSGSTAAGLTAVLTGRHPLESCVYSVQDAPPLESPTLAERFRGAGFRTAAFAAGVTLEPDVALGRGFELCEPGVAPGLDESVLEAARQWSSTLGTDERFFLWIHLRGPAGWIDEGGDPEPYDEAVARTTGRLTSFLRFLAGAEGSVDRLSSTALVVTSPNGMELGERGGFVGHRRSLLDTALHVPLVLRHTASLTGRRIFDQVVGLERVAPTLADWLALPSSGDRPGLLPLVDGDVASDPDAAVVSTHGGRVFALRTRSRRLVWNPGGRVEDPTRPVPELALYDVDADPRALRNLAAERPGEVRELLGLLVSRIGSLGSDCLPPGELDELRRLAAP